MVNPFETRRRTVSMLVFLREKRTSLLYCSLALEFETPNLQLLNLWLGRMYDKRGNYGVPWWTNRSVEQYKARSECMVNQYSDFSYFGKHVSTNTNHLLIKTWDKPKPYNQYASKRYREKLVLPLDSICGNRLVTLLCRKMRLDRCCLLLFLDWVENLKRFNFNQLERIWKLKINTFHSSKKEKKKGYASELYIAKFKVKSH